MSVMRWLLDSDPSIRWQVMRDLSDGPNEIVAAERSRVASEGWGARLLDLQLPDGHWGREDRGWMTTTYTLLLLKDLGVDPADEQVRRAIALVRDRITWRQLDGRPYFDGETEPCINGGILAVGAYFGEASDRLIDRLLDEQLEDGGWNCEAPSSKRSSFHTTICVLEGLLEYERTRGATSAVTHARVRAQDYLLERRMLRSLTSGEVIDRRWMRFSFPTTWHYDWTGTGTELPSRGLLKDVGIGLRFGNRRSGLGNIIHVDLAFPLDGDSSIEGLQILVETKERF